MMRAVGGSIANFPTVIPALQADGLAGLTTAMGGNPVLSQVANNTK
jgi:hypothetical protein